MAPRLSSLIALCLAFNLSFANDEVFLVFYHGNNPNEFTRYTTSNFGNVFDHPNFRRNAPSTFFSYGNLQTLTNPLVQNIINGYLQATDVNFIAIDYSLSWILDGGVQRLGDQLGFGLINLFNRGYNSAFVHLIGFGTGAHIVSVASLHTQREFHFISRVTGLSPTYTANPNQLAPNVAQFVDTIHTNTAGHGNFNSLGMTAFFVNGGERQPWCGADHACSHDSAMLFWAESITTTQTIFPALRCNAWETFCRGQCNDNEVGHMGVLTHWSTRGLHFLQTHHSSPFSRDVPTPDGACN